jgi:hypothetical protein
MRTGKIVFVSSVAALAALTVPALANNSAQKITEQPTSSPCKAYQQAPDGSWTQLPCQELGSGNQPQHKSATRSSDQETR